MEFSIDVILQSDQSEGWVIQFVCSFIIFHIRQHDCRCALLVLKLFLFDCIALWNHMLPSLPTNLIMLQAAKTFLTLLTQSMVWYGRPFPWKKKQFRGALSFPFPKLGILVSFLQWDERVSVYVSVMVQQCNSVFREGSVRSVLTQAACWGKRFYICEGFTPPHAPVFPSLLIQEKQKWNCTSTNTPCGCLYVLWCKQYLTVSTSMEVNGTVLSNDPVPVISF